MLVYIEDVLKSIDCCTGLPIPAIFFFFFVFFVCLFRAVPAAHGGSQVRGQIGAVAAILHHSHSNVGSEPCL